MMKVCVLAWLTAMIILLLACSPEVGSKDWCEAMVKKDKSDWTAKELKVYAEKCVIN